MVEKGLLAHIGAHGEPPLGLNYHAEMGFTAKGGLSNYEVPFIFAPFYFTLMLTVLCSRLFARQLPLGLRPLGCSHRWAPCREENLGTSWCTHLVSTS